MRRAAPLLVAVATLACFAPTIRYGFVWDDYDNIVWNPRVQELSGENLAWMFTDTSGHYIPLTWLSLSLDYAIWSERAGGFHLTNIILHAINALLLFAVLSRLLPESDVTPLAAAIGALLFAVHPQRVESVAWVTERRDLLMGCFALSSLYFYLRGGRWLILSCALFAMSLLSKTMSMGLPVVMMMLDVWPLRRWGRRAILEKIPFLLLTGAAIGMTYHTQQDVGALVTAKEHTIADAAREPGFRACFYAAKAIVPWNLSPLYLHRPGPFEFKHVATWAIVLIVTGIFIRKRWWAPTMAWLAFLVMIAPVLGLFQAGLHFAADRYTYLATIPFAALAAACAATWKESAVVWLAAVAALLVVSLRQMPVWESDLALWEHAVAVDANEVTHYYRGVAHELNNDPVRAMQDYDEAIRLNPGVAVFYNARAHLRRARNDLPGAMLDYSRAIELSPDSPAVYLNRGEVRLQAGDREGAREDVRTALEKAPPDWPARPRAEGLLETLR